MSHNSEYYESNQSPHTIIGFILCPNFSNKPPQSIQTQPLEIPHTSNSMHYGIGFQGVTQLVQSQYKVRYSGLTHYEQQPTTGFTKKKKRTQEKVSKAVLQYRKFKRMQTINKPKQYTIKASMVKSRIKAYINSQIGTKQLYFWTVTFPLKTNDETALLLLNKWLTRLRQERMLKSYLWVNERQENGTLHYHLAIPHKMDVKKANRYMRASIMTCINQKLIAWTREAAKNYNGVDLAKDRKTRRVINFAVKKRERSLTNYITKYVTKNTQPYNQLAWHNSRDFSNLIIRVNLTYDEFLKSRFPSLIVNDNPLTTENFIFYRWKGNPPDELLKHINQIQSLINSIT